MLNKEGSNKNNFSNKKLKFAAIFLSVFLLGNIIFTEPAKAQLAAMITNPISSMDEIIKMVKEFVGGALKMGVTKGVNYFVEKLAYDSAVWLASGDYNKGPLFVTDASGYFTDVGYQAAGEVIAGLTDDPNSPFTKMLQSMGINSLCVPPDLNIQLSIKLNLMKEQNPPQARCDFRKIMEAYKQIGTGEYWKTTGVSVRPGKNELSSWQEASGAVDEITATGRQNAIYDRGTGGNGETLTKSGPISKDATTPKPLVAAEQEGQSGVKNSDKTKNDAQSTGELLANMKFAAAAASVADIFLNTLADQAMKKLTKNGFFSVIDGLKALSPKKKGGAIGGVSSLALTSFESQAVNNREIAEAAFADFLTVNTTELAQYTYLGDLQTKCEDNPNPYCGALDGKMAQVLAKALSGQGMTVKEALDGGILENWPLMPSLSGVDCPSNGAYCYDNLVKLRIFRILPVGWEIAAQRAPPTGTALKEIMNKFYEPNSPFYHLIDPNWILKAPMAKCGAQVYGKQLVSAPTDSAPGQRAKYCADIQHCLEEDGVGGCKAWGYCLQEKNIWRLGGNSCDKQFNTCTTYNSAAGEQESYLASTVDIGICDANNTGCAAYSFFPVFPDNNDPWYWKTSGSISLSIGYFNGKTEQCSADSAGCNKFVRTAEGVAGEELLLKKAPAMFDCYGESLAVPSGGTPGPTTFSSSTLAWAVNKADIQKIQNNLTNPQKEFCANYSPVCSAEENGCELYTPENNRPAVPGILSANDLCPAECAGYQTYEEQSVTKFSSPATNYFIPATAKKCPSAFAGCEAFVNLEKQGQGGETKEYYTDLRSCSKNTVEGASYYTWEGSDTSGYQLKSYTLKQQTGSGDNTDYLTWFGDIGTNGPVYNSISSNDLDNFSDSCSAAVYGNRLVAGNRLDPDCREFYDKDGKKYYRLYSHTITVSPDACQRLRLATADENYCDRAGGSWDGAGGICVFFAIPGEGKACAAEMNGCRAYKGNAGNNFQTIYSEDFENGDVGAPATLTGWGGTFSAEATVVGGKSLKVSNNTGLEFYSEKGQTLIIYFWAKGSGSALNFTMTEVGQGQLTSQVLNLTNNWLPYSIGPITIPATNTTTLNISGTGLFFIDNFAAKQMTDNIYVIKDSWQTPSSCDNLIGDAMGQSQGGNEATPYRLAPQAQLGCENYKDRQEQAVAVRSFSNLCREEAVGCEGLVNTYNTMTTSSVYYNLSCTFATINTTNLPVTCKDAEGITRCSVVPGEKTCFFNYTGALSEIRSGTGNVIDTNSSTLIYPNDRTVYLVNDQKYYCSADNIGCAPVGKVSYESSGSGATLPSSTETAYLKINPEKFSDILCQSEAVGCQTYTTAQGSLAYFKDPTNQNKLCEYKESVNLNDGTITGIPGRAGIISGWFKKDIGVCGTSSSVVSEFCKSDSDCGGTNKCYGIGKLACDDYIVAGSKNYGIYDRILTRKDTTAPSEYAGFVGLCPAEQNTCTEFVDPAGAKTDQNALGQSYYMLDDGKLDKSSCHGQASQELGCVLFNQTTLGSLTWNATNTYVGSQTQSKANGATTAVNPVNCGTTSGAGNKCSGAINDSNTILKVTRDRICDKWLACKSSRVFGEAEGNKEVCTDMDVCEGYQKVAGGAQSGATSVGSCSKWTSANNKINYLAGAKNFPTGVSGKNYKSDIITGMFSDRNLSGYTIPDSYQINALKVSSKNLLQTPSPKQNPDFSASFSCRGYPVAEVPKKAGTEESSTDLSNDCSHTKVVFSGKGGGTETKYYKYGQTVDAGICQGGYYENNDDKTGLSCQRDSDCSDERPTNSSTDSFSGGICLTNAKVSRLSGWEGYCLLSSKIKDKDAETFSNVCTLWYPIQTPSNSISKEDLNSSAGYMPPEGSGKYWCVQAKGNANKTNGMYKFTTRKEDAQGKHDLFPPVVDGGFVTAKDGWGNHGQNCINNLYTGLLLGFCSQCGADDFLSCLGDAPKWCVMNKCMAEVCTNGWNHAVITDWSTNSNGNARPEIKCNLSSSGTELSRNDFFQYLELELAPNDKEKNLHYSEIIAVGIEPTAYAFGDSILNWPATEMLMFTNQKLEGVLNGGDATGQKLGFFESWPLKYLKNKDEFVLDLVWAKGEMAKVRMNYDSFNEERCKMMSQRLDLKLFANALAVRLTFNGETGLLSKISSKECSGEAGDGGIAVNLNFYLSEVCYDIRQVVNNNPADVNVAASPMGFTAKGRTDRLWQSGNYQLGGDEFTSGDNRTKNFLAFDFLSAPFGSFNQNSDPVSLSLGDFLSDKEGVLEKQKALKKFGYWPIWMNAGGATPLNCAGVDGGDCGKVFTCENGPHKNLTCTQKENTNFSGTESPLYVDGNTKCNNEIKAGTCGNPGKFCSNNISISCSTDSDCATIDFLDCRNNTYCTWMNTGKEYFPPNATDNSCYKEGENIYSVCATKFPEASLAGACNTSYRCVGGKNDGQFCFKDTGNLADNSGKNCSDAGLVPYRCTDEQQIQGMCVGGLNHGDLCASAKDCPPKTYSGTLDAKEVKEQGVCVGSVLDTGKTFPTLGGQSAGTGLYNQSSANGGHGSPNASFNRLFELFVSSYNTWGWAENGFSPVGGHYVETWGAGDQSNSSKTYNGPVNNPSAGFTVVPPKIYSVGKSANKITINSQDGNSSVTAVNGNVILQFYAFASHDQMPITRVAVDWGDGSPVNVMRGWFKNHKPKCGFLTDPDVLVGSIKSPDYGMPGPSGEFCTAAIKDYDGCRVRFGDSDGACQEDSFTFKHVYSCPGAVVSPFVACNGINYPCWNNSQQVCKFKPKVQVLDNWGWCNGVNSNGNYDSYWNDNDLENELNRNCSVEKTLPWTPFSNLVEVKP